MGVRVYVDVGRRAQHPMVQGGGEGEAEAQGPQGRRLDHPAAGVVLNGVFAAAACQKTGGVAPLESPGGWPGVPCAAEHGRAHSGGARAPEGAQASEMSLGLSTVVKTQRPSLWRLQASGSKPSASASMAVVAC